MKYLKLYEDHGDMLDSDFLWNLMRNALRNNSQETFDFAIEKGFYLVGERMELIRYCIREIYNFESLKMICVDEQEYKAILESILVINIHMEISETPFETFKLLPNLQQLIINAPLDLNNLDFMKYIPNLKELAIAGSKKPFDLSGLKYTTSLKELNLNNNVITDVKFLKGLDKLTYLDLLKNKITDLNGIEDCKSLKKLLIQYNNIEDLSPIKELYNLEFLSISGNPVRSIKPLKDLINLENFYYEDDSLNIPFDEVVMLDSNTLEMILNLNTEHHVLGDIPFKYSLLRPDNNLISREQKGGDIEQINENTKLFYLRKVYFSADQSEPPANKHQEKENWVKNVYTPYFKKYIEPWIEENGWYLWSY